MHCAVFEQLSLGQRLLFFAGHFPPLTMFWESIKVTKNQRMKALPPVNKIPLGAKTLFPFFFWGGGREGSINSQLSPLASKTFPSKLFREFSFISS